MERDALSAINLTILLVCQSRTSKKQPTNFCEKESDQSDSDNSVLMMEHTLNNVKMTKKQLSVQLALSHERL